MNCLFYFLLLHNYHQLQDEINNNNNKVIKKPIPKNQTLPSCNLYPTFILAKTLRRSHREKQTLFDMDDDLKFLIVQLRYELIMQVFFIWFQFFKGLGTNVSALSKA